MGLASHSVALIKWVTVVESLGCQSEVTSEVRFFLCVFLCPYLFQLRAALETCVPSVFIKFFWLEE